jgi:hypothetical protein
MERIEDVLWKDTLVDCKEIYEEVDWFNEHWIDNCGFYLRIDKARLHFRNSNELRVLLESYYRACENGDGEPDYDKLCIETLDNRYDVAWYKIDYCSWNGECYTMKWEIEEEWKEMKMRIR